MAEPRHRTLRANSVSVVVPCRARFLPRAQDFGMILEELRAALARRYLKDRELPISEIAWLLGYREISSFTHAFKRWTGMNPRQFRSSGPSGRTTQMLATGLKRAG